ncbi:MAG: hypothetical protein NVSMB22_00580 [Chloroflexota bacterium]
MASKQTGARPRRKASSKKTLGSTARAKTKLALRSATKGRSGSVKSSVATKAKASTSPLASKARAKSRDGRGGERVVMPKVRKETGRTTQSPLTVSRLKRVAVTVVDQATQGVQKIGELVSTVATDVVHRVT